MNTQTNESNIEKSQDFLEILLRNYLSVLENATNRHRTTISMNDSSVIFFEGDQEKFADVLAQLHFNFGLTKNYRNGVEFEAFPTLGDAYEYIAIQTMINDGLIEVENIQ